MEDQKHIGDSFIIKPRKKKASSQYPQMFQSAGGSTRTLKGQKGQKGPKRGVVNEVSPSERSNPDNEYRALRRKYLLLEEESFVLGRELKEVEDDVKALEEEKLSLLDELVVLEGLVDPSDIQPHGHRLQ